MPINSESYPKPKAGSSLVEMDTLQVNFRFVVWAGTVIDCVIRPETLLAVDEVA